MLAAISLRSLDRSTETIESKFADARSLAREIEQIEGVESVRVGGPIMNSAGGFDPEELLRNAPAYIHAFLTGSAALPGIFAVLIAKIRADSKKKIIIQIGGSQLEIPHGTKPEQVDHLVKEFEKMLETDNVLKLEKKREKAPQ